MSKHNLGLSIHVIYIMFAAHQILGGGFHLTNQDVNMTRFGKSLQSKVGDATKSYMAMHQTYEGTYFGFVATLDVYRFEINYSQRIISSVRIVNRGPNDNLEENAIRIGWQVFPELYGDSHTHFFTYWTRDSYRTTGCYNMRCPGFQLTLGSKITPGDVISPVSDVDGARQKITIKEKSTGDWWIYYGFNSAPTVVGYFPANLFTNLSEKATSILFGGSVLAVDGASTPPMGSGLLPSILSDKAASIEDILLVDEDGKIAPFDVKTIKDETSDLCYDMTPIFGESTSRCLYGSPGGCVVG
uniref:Neprosin PEP catalytic domain-containing protein n=1 Tax=Oryza glumipatula TaxID=40148 RepID=A0A0E0BSN7_9ORYZ